MLLVVAVFDDHSEEGSHADWPSWEGRDFQSQLVFVVQGRTFGQHSPWLSVAYMFPRPDVRGVRQGCRAHDRFLPGRLNTFKGPKSVKRPNDCECTMQRCCIDRMILV